MKSTLLKICAHTIGAPVIMTGKSMKVTGAGLIKTGMVTAAAGVKVETAGTNFRDSRLKRAVDIAEQHKQERAMQENLDREARLETLRREIAEIEASAAPMVPA